ncbi:hypothetical protein BT63DRAFT_478415 [Microthyrium microscopicum]|uniref:Uncharacterized protein n=1 Tax=Microthyrium microscopicum TaxID=703497 RepID=A0A6A6UEL1_9PEZI|nr:hypothetical protein BT63DRAFT_478415 [Microthyrium microscopicum]
MSTRSAASLAALPLELLRMIESDLSLSDRVNLWMVRNPRLNYLLPRPTNRKLIEEATHYARQHVGTSAHEAIRCLWCSQCNLYRPRSELRFLHWNGHYNENWALTAWMSPPANLAASFICDIADIWLQELAPLFAKCDKCRSIKLDKNWLHTLSFEIRFINYYIEHHDEVRARFDDYVALTFPRAVRNFHQPDLPSMFMWFIFDRAMLSDEPLISDLEPSTIDWTIVFSRLVYRKLGLHIAW